MAETSGEITRHIHDAEADLKANIEQLELRVKAAIDWRRQYRRAPATFLAAAASGGALLAFATSRGGDGGRSPTSRRSAAPAGRPAGALESTLDEIKAALLGAAVTQAKSALAHLLRGLNEQPGDEYDHSR